jgi:hypothetical protein
VQDYRFIGSQYLRAQVEKRVPVAGGLLSVWVGEGQRVGVAFPYVEGSGHGVHAFAHIVALASSMS